MAEGSSSPVLRICVILVRIRIRLRILPFSSLTFKTATKKFAYKVFCLIRFEGTFTSFFKDKKVIKKSVGSRFFLLFLLDDRRIRIRLSYLWLQILGRAKIYGSGYATVLSTGSTNCLSYFHFRSQHPLTQWNLRGGR
jgi:hypothetical protein